MSLFAVLAGGVFHTHLLEHAGHLLARHTGIVDQQHVVRLGILGTVFDDAFGDVVLAADHFLEHLFNVDDLDQLVLDLGHRSHVSAFSRALGRRQNVLPVHIDDAVDRIHQKALNLAVVLGDDGELVLVIAQRRAADRHRQIHDGNGLAAHVRDPAHHRMRLRHLGQRRTLHHLLNLEHVDAVTLPSTQVEQQQLQAVVTRQLGAHIYAVKNARHRCVLSC